MAKKNTSVSVTQSEGAFTFAFAGMESVTVKVTDFSEAIRAHFESHGMIQKLRDSYAGAKNVAEAFASFMKVLDALKANTWGTRVAGEPKEEPIEVLAQALAVVKYGRDLAGEKVAEILAKLKGFDKAKRDTFRRMPDVMVEIARVKAAKAAPVAATALDEI